MSVSDWRGEKSQLQTTLEPQGMRDELFLKGKKILPEGRKKC